MLTKQELNTIINNFHDGVKEIFGESLKEVILFGSYARGDFEEGSDIDIMLIVDIEENLFHNYRSLVLQIADKADWDYDTLLSPIMVNYSDFEKHKDYAPFYSRVIREGVRLIA